MDNTNQLGSFIDQIRWLHEVEYGDFKRKVGLYLTRLEKSLDAEKLRAVRDVIAQIRQDVIFNNKDDIEFARRRTLELAELIRARLNVRH
ncbi:MAG: hypothetical protein AB7N80_11320 [Bdellovibrionales bacterium]